MSKKCNYTGLRKGKKLSRISNEERYLAWMIDKQDPFHLAGIILQCKTK